MYQFIDFNGTACNRMTFKKCMYTKEKDTLCLTMQNVRPLIAFL